MALKKKTASDTKTVKIGSELDFASKEAYNLLRTNISFAFPDKVGGRVIGVTSACPQEGKSTASMNLSYSLAEAGNKVFLMDADMRRPSICGTLSLPMSNGLSNLLSGGENVTLHKGTMHSNITVLTSGDIPPNPSELIGSNKMKDILEQYRKEYDYVVIDLPPVLSVSDAVAISKYVDGMVVVVRNGSTRRRDVVEVVRQLDYAEAKILGFVYNKVGYRKTRHYSNMKKYGYDSKTE